MNTLGVRARLLGARSILIKGVLLLVTGVVLLFTIERVDVFADYSSITIYGAGADLRSLDVATDRGIVTTYGVVYGVVSALVLGGVYQLRLFCLGVGSPLLFAGKILEGCKYDPSADRSYDMMRGGFVWTDELPARDSGRYLAAIALLAKVIAYRGSLTLGEPRDEYRKEWEYLMEVLPDWPGFRLDRWKGAVERDLRAAEIRATRCLAHFEVFFAQVELLEECTYDPAAYRHYDAMRGGFIWTDELPHLGSIKLIADLFTYRGSLALGEPRDEFRRQWEELEEAVPGWPGFRLERRKGAVEKDLRAARIREARCLAPSGQERGRLEQEFGSDRS